MPRTKQRRGRGNSAESEQAIRDFNRLVQLKIHKLEMEHRAMQQKFDTMIEMSLNRFPTEIQNMMLRELVNIPPTPKKEEVQERPPKTPRTVTMSTTKSRLPTSTVKRTTKRTTTTSDDGYQSESMNSQASKFEPPGAKKSRISRTRNSTQNRDKAMPRSLSEDRQLKLTAVKINTAQKKSQKDFLITPQTKPTNNTFVITPKVKFNSVVNVLRKPKDGEMVFSTQGSPLLVSTTVNDRTANVNVPLQNGQIVSLLPFNSSLTENLVLDDETKHQLKILQNHLAKVLN